MLGCDPVGLLNLFRLDLVGPTIVLPIVDPLDCFLLQADKEATKAGPRPAPKLLPRLSTRQSWPLPKRTFLD
jgi:hypothetical protein